MFHGHGQSDTDLFHPAVKRDSEKRQQLRLEFQIAFEQSRAQFKGNSTKKFNFFTLERLGITFERGGQTAKAKTNII